MIAASSTENEKLKLMKNAGLLLGVLHFNTVPGSVEGHAIVQSPSCASLIVDHVRDQRMHFRKKQPLDSFREAKANIGRCQFSGIIARIQCKLLNRSASKRTRMLSRMVKEIMLLPP